MHVDTVASQEVGCRGKSSSASQPVFHNKGRPPSMHWGQWKCARDTVTVVLDERKAVNQGLFSDLNIINECVPV